MTVRPIGLINTFNIITSLNSPKDIKNILIFPGSQRKQSLNGRLAAHLGIILQQYFEVDIVASSEIDLPLFNQDLELDNRVLDKVRLIYARFLRADGILVVSPEYNGSVSPYLKNTIDWISRIPRLFAEQGHHSPFLHKPLLLASATSGGSGGVLGLQSARNLFAYLGCLTLAEQLSLPYAGEAWNGDGFLTDPYFNSSTEMALDQFGKLINNINLT